MIFVYYAELTDDLLLRGKLLGLGYNKISESAYSIEKDCFIELVNSVDNTRERMTVSDLLDFMHVSGSNKYILVPNVAKVGRNICYTDLDSRNSDCLSFEDLFFLGNYIPTRERGIVINAVDTYYYLDKNNCVMYNGKEVEGLVIKSNFKPRSHRVCYKVVSMSKDGRDLFCFSMSKHDDYPILVGYRDGKFESAITSRVKNRYFKNKDIEDMWKHY